MKIESRREGKAAIVTVSGRMDAESAPAFDAAGEELLKDGATHVVVEMADLQYVSSMGLRSFLLLARQTKAKGGSVHLCGMKGFVKEVFDMTNVTQLFPLHESVDSAVQSL